MRTSAAWSFSTSEPANQGNFTSAPFTASLNCFPALNRTTLRALMGASRPVFGLRPTRAFFSLTLKEPKRLNMTDSPLARDSLTASMIASTASSALTLLSPVSSNTRLMMSIFVKGLLPRIFRVKELR